MKKDVEALLEMIEANKPVIEKELDATRNRAEALSELLEALNHMEVRGLSILEDRLAVVEYDDERLLWFLRDRAKSTARCYQTMWHEFEQWCDENEEPSLEAATSTVREYLRVQSVENCLREQHLRKIHIAIKHVHCAHGLEQSPVGKSVFGELRGGVVFEPDFAHLDAASKSKTGKMYRDNWRKDWRPWCESVGSSVEELSIEKLADFATFLQSEREITVKHETARRYASRIRKIYESIDPERYSLPEDEFWTAIDATDPEPIAVDEPVEEQYEQAHVANDRRRVAVPTPENTGKSERPFGGIRNAAAKFLGLGW